MAQALALLVLGAAVGVLSGLIGVGGGVFLIPALVFLFGMTQHQAQGTSLAVLVPPIGILAAWTYYKQGLVDLKAAALICAGFLLGGLLGAKLAVGLSPQAMRKVFGCALIAVGARMAFGR
jgi:uncharacterized membrane protein YfcA